MTIPTDKIINTINLASRLHKHQTRHDEFETPYVTHLFAVSMYIASITDDENLIMAGLMHDSLEDVAEYTYEDLVIDCGEKVANIVRGVTEDKSLPYKERKLAYLEHLQSGSIESLIVSLADKIHNAKSYITMHEDKKHAGHAMTYNEVLKIAESRLSPTDPAQKLVEELKKAIKEVELSN